MLVEHAAQASAAANASRGTRVIALSPEAMNALDEARIEYRTPEQYLTTPELTAMGLAAYDAVLAYCERLDARLRVAWPAIARAGIGPAVLCQYEFKILADTVTLRAAELRAIIAYERPAAIHAFPTRGESLDASLAFGRESAYARVLPLVVAEAGVRLAWADRPTLPASPPKARRWLRNLVPPEWRQRLAHFRSAGLGGWRRGIGATDAVLVFNMTPDVRALMDAADEWRFVHWPGFGLPVTLKPFGSGTDLRHLQTTNEAPPTGLASAVLDDAGSVVAAPLASVVRSRLEHFVGRSVPMMLDAAARTDRVVDHYQPRAGLAGILSGPQTRAAAARARRLGVPLAVYQHGGSYGYLEHPTHYHNDLYHADWFLTYGEGVSTFLGARYGQRTPCAARIAVGSAALARATKPQGRAAHSTSAPLVLYVATCMMGQRFYAPHYRSPEYFALLTDAARALESAHDIEPVLKIHQAGDNCLNPIADWCRRHAPRVTVVTDGTLTRWLDAADLVVIDLPSTPLLEALARGVPAFVFSDARVFPLSADARPELDAAVRFETDRQQFVSTLGRGAELVREVAARPRSGAFLEKFGTGPDAPERAGAALAAICGRSPAAMAS